MFNVSLHVVVHHGTAVLLEFQLKKSQNPLCLFIFWFYFFEIDHKVQNSGTDSSKQHVYFWQSISVRDQVNEA